MIFDIYINKTKCLVQDREQDQQDHNKILIKANYKSNLGYIQGISLVCNKWISDGLLFALESIFLEISF